MTAYKNIMIITGLSFLVLITLTRAYQHPDVARYVTEAKKIWQSFRF